MASASQGKVREHWRYRQEGASPNSPSRLRVALQVLLCSTAMDGRMVFCFVCPVLPGTVCAVPEGLWRLLELSLKRSPPPASLLVRSSVARQRRGLLLMLLEGLLLLLREKMQ